MKTDIITTVEQLEQFNDGNGNYIFEGNIDFRLDIKVKGYIEAGWHIEAGEYIFSFTFNIKATQLTTKTLPFWREYYAEMPPLQKWRKEILGDKNCWDELRCLLTQEEAKEVCQWDGWHWIIRAHLEMFFGLKKTYILIDKSCPVRAFLLSSLTDEAKNRRMKDGISQNSIGLQKR